MAIDPQTGQWYPDQPGMMEAMLPVSEPDYQAELNAPQVADPNDFFSRLAYQTGGQGPFGPMNVGHHTSGLEGLAALLAGFVNAKTRGAAHNINKTDEQNQRARENAKALAQHRWSQRSKEESGNIATRNIALSKILSKAGGNPSLDEQIRHNRAMEGLAGRRIEDTSGESSDIYGQMLISGELTDPSKVPQRYRRGALEYVRNHNEVILSPKVRTTVQELNSARVILKKLKELNKQIPRGEGAGRLLVGPAVKGQAMAQTPGVGRIAAQYEKLKQGMLSTLSRASGERGVLTDKDLERIQANIPGLMDEKKLSEGMLDTIDGIFNEIQQSAVRTYTKPGAGQGATAEPSAPAGSDRIRITRNGTPGTILRSDFNPQTDKEIK